jgi:hypothetical protein
VLNILANLLQTLVVPGFPRNQDVQPQQIAAQISLAAELLDFTPRVSLIAGLAHVVGVLADGDQAERDALTSVGLDARGSD